MVIVVPLFERQAAGIYRNSAAVIDADGALLGVYSQMHIPDDPLFYEKYYFTPGDATQDEQGTVPGTAMGFRVWETRYAKIGVLICWDQWYPEAARITSLLGADVLLYPTAIGWTPRRRASSGRPRWRRGAPCSVGTQSPTACTLRQPTASATSQPGTNGLEFFGHSFVSDPFGRMIADAGTQPEVLVASCDTAVIEDTRRNWPFLRDRRIDAYGPILQRYLG